MKRRTPYLLIFCLLVSLSLTGCHKVCTCIGYDNRQHEFTAEEVNDRTGGNCTDMADYPVADRYSYCHW
ncbi:MAG: hypothetical protein IK058_02540 [Bacteroidales bacterium]|nr:hypothetical protein [Bacteroidales bacterium]